MSISLHQLSEELNSLTWCLRGKEFNEDIVLFDLKFDDLVTECVLPFWISYVESTMKRFKGDFRGPLFGFEKAGCPPGYRAVTGVVFYT